jgi:hypothetical protein
MTNYVILKQNATKTWEEIGERTGNNDLGAIKSFLEADKDGKHGAGVYRAVPRRSWPREAHELKPKVSFV